MKGNPTSLWLDVIHIINEAYMYLEPGNGRRGRDRMIVGFTTTYAISA